MSWGTCMSWKYLHDVDPRHTSRTHSHDTHPGRSPTTYLHDVPPRHTYLYPGRTSTTYLLVPRTYLHDVPPRHTYLYSGHTSTTYIHDIILVPRTYLYDILNSIHDVYLRHRTITHDVPLRHTTSIELDFHDTLPRHDACRGGVSWKSSSIGFCAPRHPHVFPTTWLFLHSTTPPKWCPRHPSRTWSFLLSTTWLLLSTTTPHDMLPTTSCAHDMVKCTPRHGNNHVVGKEVSMSWTLLTMSY